MIGEDTDERRSRRVMPIILAAVLLVLFGLLLDRTPEVHGVGPEDGATHHATHEAGWPTDAP